MDETDGMDFSLKPLAIYRTPTGAAALAPVVLLGAGSQQVRSAIEHRSLPNFGALLVGEGRGRFWSKPSGEIGVTAPALVWLFPDVEHSYGPTGGNAWTEAWTLFDGSLPRDAARAGYLSQVRPVLTPGQPAALHRLFQRFIVEFETLPPARAGLLLHELLLTAPQVDTVREDIDALMDEAAERLAHDSGQLPDLAHALGISPATLRRRFVARHGMPPKAYQLRLRLDRAKEMLTLTDQTIEQVARSVGFDDSYYFSRLFHAREHCSPSEFRRQHRRS